MGKKDHKRPGLVLILFTPTKYYNESTPVPLEILSKLAIFVEENATTGFLAPWLT